MSLSAKTCPICGANINSNRNQNVFFCDYCGSTVENISILDRVKVDGIEGFEELLDKGSQWLTLENWNEALNTYEKAIQSQPMIAAAHIGKFKAISWNLTRHIDWFPGDNIYKHCEVYFDLRDQWDMFNKKIVSDDIKSSDFYSKFLGYLNSIDEQISSIISDTIVADKRIPYSMLVEDAFAIPNICGIVVTGFMKGIIQRGCKCKFIDKTTGEKVAEAMVLNFERYHKLLTGIAASPESGGLACGVLVKCVNESLSKDLLMDTILIDERVKL